MQMEQKFEEMKRKMDMEIEKIKQELAIERDSKKRIKRQAKKTYRFLKERVRILEKQIEEIKDMNRNTPTSKAYVEDAKAGVFRENDGNAQQAEHEEEVEEGQWKTKHKEQALEKTEIKQQEPREYEKSHSSNAPSQGGMEDTKLGVDNEGSAQKIKSHIIAFFVWIWKGLRLDQH